MVNTAQDIAIFDRNRARQNRLRVRSRLDKHRFLIDWTEDQLADRLRDIKREFPVTLKMQKDSWHVGNQAGILGDEECLPFGENTLDLILSTLTLHSVNDLPGALVQINRALKPDGLFLAALFGGETLYELRESLMQAELKLKGGASPRVFPFADKQQTGALLQRAGFALPVVDSDIVTVTYDNIFRLMHDLRFMGESNIIRERSRTNPGKAFFMEAAQYYQDHFAETNGRIRASFEIIFMIGWAPHESQQKPLRPGSAQSRLADALDTEELKTGTKAAP